MSSTTAIGLARSITSNQQRKLYGRFFTSGLTSTSSNVRRKATIYETQNARRSARKSASFMKKSYELTNTALVLDSMSKYVNKRA